MIFGRSSGCSRNKISRWSQSLCRKITFSHRAYRIPEMIEAWFISSEKITTSTSDPASKRSFQFDNSCTCPRNVAGATSSASCMNYGRLQGVNDCRMLPHPEIIIGTPDDHILWAIWAVPCGKRMTSNMPFKLDKTAIEVFAFQPVQTIFKLIAVMQCTAPAPYVRRTCQMVVYSHHSMP